jgi:thiosulfate/3-mercaptopyruvate sulfurtransferase
VVIDARNRDRFRGDYEPVDPRPGHVPGARNVPARENLDGDGRLVPPARLRAPFAGAGVTPDTTVVSYCGSGVNACHNLLTLEQAGFPPGRLYPGSWSQWSHSDRPAATGE